MVHKLETIDLETRFKIISKTFSMLEQYFAHWNYVPNVSINKLHKKYVKDLLTTENRYKFGLLMCKLLAELRNGHTFYYDRQLHNKTGGSLGFYAFYHEKEKKWAVLSSSINKLKIGDVILKINGEPTEKFFIAASKYISGSSELEIRNKLFKASFLFPKGLKITTGRGTFAINKMPLKFSAIKPEPVFELIDKKTCYVKLPSFAKSEYAKSAVKFLKKHRDCESIIMDLRNNEGGNTPANLISALMNRKYRRFAYKEVIQEQISYILDSTYVKRNKIKTRYKLQKSKCTTPLKSAYNGKVFILVNQFTLSAGEDFSFPFKDNGRATLIGIKTAGTNGSALIKDFGDGIYLGMGVVQVIYPNGTRFEGIGIKPDIEVYPAISDIKQGKDHILERAISLARKS
jgi:carboxyl-terminal processing protease